MVTSPLQSTALPDRALGYDSADVVVLHLTDAKLLGSRNDDIWARALAKWVEGGGRLIVLLNEPAAQEIIDGSHLTCVESMCR